MGKLWEKVQSIGKRVWQSPIALVIRAVGSMSAPVDVLSDMLTAIEHGRMGQVWWCAWTFVVVYLSSRFTVLFLALRPKPTWKNLVWLYVPGLWIDKQRLSSSTSNASAKKTSPEVALRLTEGETGTFLGENYGTGVQNEGSQAYTAESEAYTTAISRHIRTIYTNTPEPTSLCETVGLALWMEIQLVPLACLAIVPIAVHSWILCRGYLHQAAIRCNCCAGSLAQDLTEAREDYPSSNDERVETTDLYLQTVSLVEAVFESIPQLILQIHVYYYTRDGKIDEWLFFLTVCLSAVSALRAVATFIWNRKGIIQTLDDMQWLEVLDFAVRETGAEAPDRDEGWKVATATEVTGNMERLMELECLDTWCIATLADGMEVGGSGYAFNVTQRGGSGGNYVLYSRTA